MESLNRSILLPPYVPRGMLLFSGFLSTSHVTRRGIMRPISTFRPGLLALTALLLIGPAVEASAAELGRPTDRKFKGPNEVRGERGQREAWDAGHGAAGLA
jgi:hypothetical protein